MTITFEEVTAEIQRDPDANGKSGTPAPAAATPGQGVQGEIEQALRLMAERSARVHAD